MRLVENLRSLSRRSVLCVGAGVLALGLAACSGDDQATAGSAFTQALSKNYHDLAGQASELPGDAAESSFWDSLNPFSAGDTSSGRLAGNFTAKAELADEGSEPEPEAASGAAQATLRARLVRALSAGKDQYPEQAARAQADYDCWVVFGTAPVAATASQACRSALDMSMVALESAARPVPPPVASTAPPTADIAPPPPAEAAASAQSVNRMFTVYFDFDSWTLKAEQLKVLDDVIAAARSGGQGNINIVGHTDTSGTAGYNQRLSVRRANVVVEALVQMGARRAALHASGVGEADLAVETADGVKEARNRRTIVTMQP